jgi:hypothetical protein
MAAAMSTASTAVAEKSVPQITGRLSFFYTDLAFSFSFEGRSRGRKTSSVSLNQETLIIVTLGFLITSGGS